MHSHYLKRSYLHIQYTLPYKEISSHKTEILLPLVVALYSVKVNIWGSDVLLIEVRQRIQTQGLKGQVTGLVVQNADG